MPFIAFKEVSNYIDGAGSLHSISSDRLMPPRQNPLKLNPLQLRTLTLLQAIARVPRASTPGPNGEVVISRFPDAHGDHLHLGDGVVSGKDTTGLYNRAVWNALTRKGLARADWPHSIALTPEGITYDTGPTRDIIKRTAD